MSKYVKYFILIIQDFVIQNLELNYKFKALKIFFLKFFIVRKGFIKFNVARKFLKKHEKEYVLIWS